MFKSFSLNLILENICKTHLFFFFKIIENNFLFASLKTQLQKQKNKTPNKPLTYYVNMVSTSKLSGLLTPNRLLIPFLYKINLNNFIIKKRHSLPCKHSIFTYRKYPKAK